VSQADHFANGSEIMSTYHASIPPDGATCQSDLCRSRAVVRLTVPPRGFTADGGPAEVTTWDSCDLHWVAFRDVCLRSGHEIADCTGDLGALVDESPRWDIWRSDLGRLYASTVLPSRHGTTVDAYLIGQLRAEMREVESRVEGRPCTSNA